MIYHHLYMIFKSFMYDILSLKVAEDDIAFKLVI